MSVDVTSLWSQSSPSSEFSTFSGSWSLVGGGGDVGELGGGGGGGGGGGDVGVVFFTGKDVQHTFISMHCIKVLEQKPWSGWAFSFMD